MCSYIAFVHKSLLAEGSIFFSLEVEGSFSLLLIFLYLFLFMIFLTLEVIARLFLKVNCNMGNIASV